MFHWYDYVLAVDYKTIANPHGRAISGLSMGGRHTMFVGLKSLDLCAGETGHDWSTWRNLLYYGFLPNLWKK